MLLKNGDIAVLRYIMDDFYIEVLNNDFLPFELKDYIKTTNVPSKEAMRYMDVFKDFLVGRTLNLSQENAKAILNSVNLPQSFKTSERLKIVEACSALTMTDNFWITDDDDNRKFSEVNLRNHHLGDAAYPISILGKTISVCKDIMEPDISTDGMFPKTWYRASDSIELWKTDIHVDNINTRVEKQSSDLLDLTNVSHVKYGIFERDGRLITKCTCLANDDVSLVDGYSFQDWCSHTNRDMVGYLEENFLVDFSRMCVIDYLIANTDRHIGNINLCIDNSTNKVIKLAPLFDHNQALIPDLIGTDIDDLIYPPTGLSMLHSAVKYFKSANLRIEIEKFPVACQERYKKVLKFCLN